jgi:hypothetical protein
MIIVKQAPLAPEVVEQAYKELGIELERSGKRWKTICPFPDHMDSVPSFVVYPDGGYHCFGCLAHGSLEDIFVLFDKDCKYYVNRIDLTAVRDITGMFIADLRKNMERRICLLSNGNHNDAVFNVYDKFDQLWMGIKTMNFTSRLQLAIYAKREFYGLIKSLEVTHDRKSA